MTWEFLATALVVVVMPGTGVIYTLAVAIGQGVRGAAFAALGARSGLCRIWWG